MRSIQALAAASLCALALLQPAIAADWIGKTSPLPPIWQAGAVDQALARVENAGKAAWDKTLSPGRRAEIVALPIDPDRLAGPTAIAAAKLMLDDALDAVRSVVARDPSLAAQLRTRGFDAGDVLGLATTRDGSVAIVVAGSA